MRLVSIRNLLFAAILLAASGGAALWFAGQGREAAPVSGTMAKFRQADSPAPLPDFAFAGPGGEAMGPADLRGKVVLLNLWATWCAPCVEEMPALDRLQARLGGDGFEVVALSLDRGGREQVEPFFDKLGIGSLAVYLDTGGASMKALSPRGLPTSILLDREGREVGRLEGAAEWDSPEALDLIRHFTGPGGQG